MIQKSKVSVCMITYNHEKYIAEAIEGVLMQETNFDFELVIGEDFSTDTTRAICEQYANKNPNIIRLLPSIRNIGSMPNFLRTLNECKGEYIALCDGDDFWIDPQKLKKQCTFLESNMDYNLITTNAEIEQDKQITSFPPRNDSYAFDFFKQILSNQCITCTVMFRNQIIKIEGSDNINKLKIGDIYIYALLLSSGALGYYSNEITARYRIHEGGVYSLKPIKENIFNEIEVYETLLTNKLFRYTQRKIIRNKLQIYWYDILANRRKYFSNFYCIWKILTNVNFSNLHSMIRVPKAIIRGIIKT